MEKEFEETSAPLVAAKCAICGEEYIATDFLAICPKCRNAILYAKALMNRDAFLRKDKECDNKDQE